MVKLRSAGIRFIGLLALSSFGSIASTAADKTVAPISTPATAASLPDLVEKVLPGVVNISSTSVVQNPLYGWDAYLEFWGIPQERKQTSLGSGFIIDKNGFVLTNNHVVEHAAEVMVTLKDKRSFRAKVIGTDPKMDLALLQIRDDKRRVPTGLDPISLGNSDKVRIADAVFAVGNPFGLQHTVTTGIISAKNRTIGLGPFDNFLQTDASINPGNSGGPLFDYQGAVIGINTVIYSQARQSAGLGFAIPVNEAKAIIDDLKRYGRVPRPWLGILGERVTAGMRRYYRLSTSEGVLVYNLIRQGPAHEAGVRLGDVIIAVDGNTTTEPYDVERFLAKHKPNEKATVRVQRGDREIEIKVQLEELPPRIDHLPAGII